MEGVTSNVQLYDNVTDFLEVPKSTPPKKTESKVGKCVKLCDMINLRKAAISLFQNSSAHLRSNENLQRLSQ